jgi:hypothetical protein
MPPEEAAAAVEAAPIAVPAAEQPPAPKKIQSLADRWKAKTGEELGSPDEVAAEPAAPAAEAPKAKAATPPDDSAAFHALAQKLGYALDGKSVLPSDRIKWESAKKRQEEGIAARERAVQEAEGKVSDRVRKAESILDAIERGDPDGFAASVGVKDFNEFQQNFIKRLADPNYQELRKLQQWKEQQEEQRKKAEEEGKTKAQQEQRATAYRTYMDSLSKTCAASSNPLVAAMHDDPLFLRSIYTLQEENWDDVAQRTITVEEAIKRASKQGGKPLEDELRTLYERLSKGFTPGETAPAAVAKTNGKKVAPKTAVTPAGATSAVAGGSKKPSQMSPQEWRAYSASKFRDVDD